MRVCHKEFWQKKKQQQHKNNINHGTYLNICISSLIMLFHYSEEFLSLDFDSTNSPFQLFIDFSFIIMTTKNTTQKAAVIRKKAWCWILDVISFLSVFYFLVENLITQAFISPGVKVSNFDKFLKYKIYKKKVWNSYFPGMVGLCSEKFHLHSSRATLNTVLYAHKFYC